MALLKSGQRDLMILILLRPYLFRLPARYCSMKLPSQYGIRVDRIESVQKNLNWDANFIL